MQAEDGQDLQVVQEDLTPAERVAFEVALASGELARLLLPWEPWWRSAKACHLSLSTAGTRLIQEHAQSSIGMLLQLTCRHPHSRYAKTCHFRASFSDRSLLGAHSCPCKVFKGSLLNLCLCRSADLAVHVCTAPSPQLRKGCSNASSTAPSWGQSSSA